MPTTARSRGSGCTGRARRSSRRGERVRPARARGRGRRQRPPAAEARALRRHALLRPAPGPLRRRDRDGRVRRGARLRRPAVRDHRPPRRSAGPRRASATGSRRGPDLLRRGPVAILHAIMDRVVDDYAPVVAGVENDIDEIEDEVFGGSPTVSRRIYELSREVIGFQRATKPLVAMLGAADGCEPASTRRSAATCATSRTTRCASQEQADGFRAAAAEHPQRQPHAGDEGAQRGLATRRTRRSRRSPPGPRSCSRPTLVGTIYGMNFEHMPELAGCSATRSRSR